MLNLYFNAINALQAIGAWWKCCNNSNLCGYAIYAALWTFEVALAGYSNIIALRLGEVPAEMFNTLQIIHWPKNFYLLPINRPKIFRLICEYIRWFCRCPLSYIRSQSVMRTFTWLLLLKIDCVSYSDSICWMLILLTNVSCLYVSIHGDRVFTHNGERTKEGIVEFAKRAYG